MATTALADEMPTKKRYSVVELNNDGRPSIVSLADLNEADQALAAKYGYKPVFKREFGFFASFSFAASISATFATIATTFVYPLEAGGAASAVWCWLISGAGCMCIAASVAELVSAYPTCGGLYFTISKVAPPRWVPVISWIDGWLNMLGQVAGLASTEYGNAQLLLAAISMGSDFRYSPTVNQTVGTQAALLVIHGAINSLPTGWLAKITTSYVVFHFLVIVSCSIALLVMCDYKHDASYVFTHVEGNAGWNPVGFSFLFGFLSVSWTMTDYDATAHIAEEIQEPERKAPWAIFLAMCFTYILGWLFTIVLVFCQGDPYSGQKNPLDITLSPMVQPVAQIFYNVLGKSGGIFFTVAAFIILNTCAITALQSLARTVFAFSRDRLVPGSRVWKVVDRRTNTPIIAVWFSVFWAIVINLIGLGSYAAVAAIFNVTAIALDWSYCIPIFCKMFFGRFEPGPWNMGKFGFWVNAWACTWTFFVTIIFILPTILPVTPLNMNYAIVILAAILVASAIHWFITGRKFYVGPISETDIIEGEYNPTEKVLQDGKDSPTPSPVDVA